MAIAGYNSQFLLSSQPSIATTNEATTTSDLTTFVISNAAHRYLDKTVAIVVQKANDELQTVTITGSPTGGTFTLSFGGQTTSALASNATAAQVQAALQALSSIGTGNALVTGNVGGPYLVEFTAGKGLLPQSLMTATSSLTGGTTPGVSIVETQVGGAFAPITTGFTLFRCNARVVFVSAQAQGTQVQFASAAYFPYLTLGEAATCEFAGKMETVDTTTFNASGAKSFTPTLLTGTMKTNTFWLNKTRCQSLMARDLIIVSFQTSTGNRYEGFCYAQDCTIKADTKGVVTQDLTFQLTDEFFNA